MSNRDQPCPLVGVAGLPAVGVRPTFLAAPQRRGFDAARYHLVELGEREAKVFVLQHHYARSWPSPVHRFGMLDRADGNRAGVLVLGIPMHPKVLLNPFPDLEPY